MRDGRACGRSRRPRPSTETRGEDEAHRDRRDHERGHGQVDEGVGVLDDAAHVGDAVEVEDAEVVDVDEREGHEEQELRPLRGVAKEDLQVLHEEGTAGGAAGDRRASALEAPEAGEAGLAGLLRLAPAGEVVAAVGGARVRTTKASAVVHRAPRWSAVDRPRRARRRGVSPAQNDGQERRDRGLEGGEEGGHVGQRLRRRAGARGGGSAGAARGRRRRAGPSASARRARGGRGRR